MRENPLILLHILDSAPIRAQKGAFKFSICETEEFDVLLSNPT